MRGGRHFDKGDAPPELGLCDSAVGPEAASDDSRAGASASRRGGRARGSTSRVGGALLKLLALCMVLAGLIVFIWPYIDAALTSLRMGEAAARYDAAVAELAEDELLYRDFLCAVDDYNRALDETGQAGLRDAWSYTEPSFDLTSWGIPDDVYARLRIPVADIDMPLYLGATEAHLSAGSAHLTQTSLPVRAVAGVSANAVVAGHRGYRANTFFNNIVNLVEGDEVYVDTPWGEAGYRVSGTAVIDPADIDAVKIQPGRTMLTLVTCHPLYHNYQRYVVYCDQV